MGLLSAAEARLGLRRPRRSRLATQSERLPVKDESTALAGSRCDGSSGAGSDMGMGRPCRGCFSIRWGSLVSRSVASACAEGAVWQADLGLARLLDLTVLTVMSTQCCSFAACIMPVFAAQLCRRHYGRQQRHGTPGCPTCRQRDLLPYQHQCSDCIVADFRRLGQDPVDITAFRRTTSPILCRCLTCGTVAHKSLGGLRNSGSQCAVCWALRRVEIARKARFTQKQAAEILGRAGWTLRGQYEGANKPVAATCQGCGKAGLRLVGDTHAKLREGTRQFGCMACVRKKFPQPRAVPIERAIQEFRDNGIEYIGGWKSGQYPVDARCAECGHMFRPSLKHVRAGHGCPRCNLTGAWTLARVQRDSSLADRPSLLYLIEFTDWDTESTVFRKVGIGTLDAISRPRGGGCDRLYRHYRDGARLISSVEGDLLTCLMAERMILKHVAVGAYTPTKNRIRGGNTECFCLTEPIDLLVWIRRARDCLVYPPRGPVLAHDSGF